MTPAEPSPRPEPSRRVATPRPPSPRGFTVLASGDVLPHRSVQERAKGYGARSGHRFDFRPMFAAIRPLVSAADLAAQSASCCPAATQDGVLLQVTIVHKAGRMVVGKVSYIPTWLEHPSYRILPVAKALARGSASPATRALLRRSLQRTTTAIGRSAHLAARR